MTPEAARVLRGEYLQLILWSALLRDGDRVPLGQSDALRARCREIIDTCRGRLGAQASDPHFRAAEQAVVSAIDAAAIHRFKEGRWKHLQLGVFFDEDAAPTLGDEVITRLQDLANFVPYELPLEVLEVYERCITLGYRSKDLKRTSEALRCAIAQRTPCEALLSPSLAAPPAGARRQWLGPMWIGALAALALALFSLGVHSRLASRVDAAHSDIQRRLAASGCK